MAEFGGVELTGLVLTGPRLTLRPWRPDDAEVVYESLREDVDVQRFTSVPVPYTRDDAIDFVARLGNAGRRDASAIECALIETRTGALVGSAGLRLPGDAEIGYIVYRHARGHGYAAEATRVLSEWAFAHGVHRVRLALHVGNLASARTALNAGFAFEGVSRGGMLRPADERGPARVADLARFARVAGDPPEPIAPAFAPFPPDGVDDGVLRLRVMQPGDAPDVLATDDDLTLRWSFTGEPHPPDDVRRSAERAALDWLVGRVAVLTMVDVATARVAGSLRVRNPGPPQVGGIGYVVHPDFRGRGYTTRALRLLVPWAFGPGDFARLELGAKVGNEASLRAAARAGFEPDGIRRRRLRNPDGTFSDEVRYALVNPRYA